MKSVKEYISSIDEIHSLKKCIINKHILDSLSEHICEAIVKGKLKEYNNTGLSQKPNDCKGEISSDGICYEIKKYKDWDTILIPTIKSLVESPEDNTTYSMAEIENRLWFGDLKGQEKLYYYTLMKICKPLKVAKTYSLIKIGKQHYIEVVAQVAYLVYHKANQLNLLNEALIKGKLKQYTTIDVESILADYQDLDDKTLKEKKELNAKYRIGSNRWQDIEKFFLLKLQEARKYKKEFDADDVKYFKRLDIPQQYAKFKEIVKNEPIEFLEYLRERQEEYLKKIKKRNGKTLFDYVNVNFGRDWNFYYSIADKYQLDYYRNIVKFLDENS